MDCEALIGILEWAPGFQTWFGLNHYHAVIDKSNPLVVVKEGEAALLIPKWKLLLSAEFLIYYRDGSILQVFLGKGNYVILRQGSRQIARERIGDAKQLLRTTRYDSLLYLCFFLGLVTIASAIFLPALHETGNISQPLSSEGSRIVIGGLAVCVPGVIRFRNRPTLPTEHMVTTVKQGWAVAYSRLVQSVLRLQWGVEDVKRLLTAIASAFIVGLLFKACS